MRYNESLKSGTAAKECWMRDLRIIFSSKNDLYGDLVSDESGTDFVVSLKEKYPSLATYSSGKGIGLTLNSDYNIRVTGKKEAALNKDGGTIAISNVSYETIATIIALELYRVTIECGYKSSGDIFTVATGEISYIQQKVNTRRDYELYISYASELVAAYSQNRINFSIRSGINLYDMFQYMFIQQGCSTQRTRFSESLKNVVANGILSNSGTSADIISSALNLNSFSTSSILASADSSLDGTVVNLTTVNDKRVIPIDMQYINFANGNPTVTSNGLNVNLFPVFNFAVGDIIEIQNRIIDASSGMTNYESVYQTFNTNYIDPDGLYMLYQINYTLENRGNNFTYNCLARPLSQMSNLGVTT